MPDVNLKPRFEVHRLEGKKMRRIASQIIEKYNEDVYAPVSEIKIKGDKPTEPILLHKAGDPKLDKDGNKKLLGGFKFEDVEHDAGWMVYFPSGASIHVWTKEELERQGFNEDPTLVNMETGDETAPMGSSSLKARSEQKNARSKSSMVKFS